MRLNKSFRFCILAVIIGLALPVFAEKLPTTRPELVGLSTERLGRIGEVMQKYVDEDQLRRAVTTLARDRKSD